MVGWRMHHRHWLASSGALTAFLPSTLDMFAEFILYVVAECAEASIFMLCGLDVSDAGSMAMQCRYPGDCMVPPACTDTWRAASI